MLPSPALPPLRLAMLALIAASFATTASAKIEAVRGKEYRLTKQHGPWMIVVASLQDREGEGSANGKTAEEAADELIFELRQKRIPAYKFRMKRTMTPIDGRIEHGRVAAGGQVSVIAGNYAAVNSDSATKSLAWIKAYYPKCLADGGVWKKTPGRPGPLSGAFLTINPLLSPDEVAAMANRSPEGRKESAERRKLLRSLNAGNPYPLHSCKGSYSLIVARFAGKSVTDVGQGEKSMQLVKKFTVGDELDKAGRDAWELCNVLRGEGVDAYLWHTRYESIVTVGTFQTPQDGRIKRYRQQFGVTYNVDAATGAQTPNFKFRKVDGFGKDRNETRLWSFLPDPKLMEVPEKP